jgi:hypothetical protein
MPVAKAGKGAPAAQGQSVHDREVPMAAALTTGLLDTLIHYA